MMEQRLTFDRLTDAKTADGHALVDYAADLGITKGAAHLRLRRGKLEGVGK